MNCQALSYMFVLVALLFTAGAHADKVSKPGLWVEVTLKLEGKTVAGQPRVALADNTFAVLVEKNKAQIALTQTAKDTWTCMLEDGRSYVIGWIAKKGWFAKHSKMYGYCSEPFVAQEGLAATFSPGMPATFEYDVRTPPRGVKATPVKVLLLREILSDGKRTFLSWGGQQAIRKPGILEITGIASGTYQISARTPDTTKHLNAHTPVLYENRVVEIKAGIANRFEPVYPKIDSTVEDGDVTIRGKLYGPDKQPLAKKTVHVCPLGPHGFDLNLYYPPATTDSQGRFGFVGICPHQPVYVSHENTSINLGKQSLTENASVTVDIVLGLKKLPIVIGEPVEEIFVDWRKGSTGKLSDLKGKVVVLDVWATSCNPCIRALPGFNALAHEFSSEQDVVFVALSVDSDEALWKKEVDQSGWTALKHGRLNRKRGAYLFNRGIPYTMIIDQNGVLRAEGHGFDIRNELDKLNEASSLSNSGSKERSRGH